MEEKREGVKDMVEITERKTLFFPSSVTGPVLAVI
jgi:hypothetical protein